MKTAIILAMLLGVGLIVFAAIWEWPRKQNVRLLVTVQTPDGLRAGESIVELRKKRFLIPASSGATTKTSVIGEAVMVDLPDAPALFLLVGDQDGLPFIAVLRPSMLFEGGKVDLQSGAQLLRFHDPDDVRSMELVSPTQISAVYGPGYVLTSITAEPTSRPMSTDIAQHLPSFGPLRTWFATLPKDDPRRRVTRDQFIRRF